MIGTVTLGGAGGLHSLHDIVTLLGDESKYAEKIRELKGQVVLAEQTLAQAANNNKEAQAVKEFSAQILKQTEEKLQALTKEKESLATTLTMIDERRSSLDSYERSIAAKQQSDLEELERVKAEHKAGYDADLNDLAAKHKELDERDQALTDRYHATEDHKAKTLAFLQERHQEHAQKEEALYELERTTKAECAELRTQTDNERRAILAKVNIELQAAQLRREEAEARSAEAERLRQEHADKLSKLVVLASDMDLNKGDN